MFVKVCGITRAEDADVAVRCGAGALGFVFWPGSPRFIDPDRARAIISGIPAFVTTVGVFVNQSAAEVNRIADRSGLGAVQLHGDESPSLAATLARPVIKALGRVDPTDVDIWPARVTLLLDAYDPVRRGGTGQMADWASAAAVARRRRVMLAGGLTADNVRDAVAQVAPFGLDVSSGVESRPGIKDPVKLEALFEALHGL